MNGKSDSRETCMMKKSSVALCGTLLAGLLMVGCVSQPATTVTAVSAPTSLMEAAANGDVAQVERLIKQGEPVNAVTDQGTALTRAAAGGHREVVRRLLIAGADPNLGVDQGQPSPLHYMVAAGDTQSMRALILSGAALDHPDANGLTPLALAARNGSLSVAKVLIQAGANVNAVYQGKSLLMHAVQQNSLLMAQVLIKAGADVNYRAEDGETALSLARRKRFVDLEMLLLQSGARV